MEPLQQAWLEIVSKEWFDPTVLTHATGLEPAEAWSVGDERKTPSGAPATRHNSMWALATMERQTYDSAVVLGELRARIVGDPTSLAAAARAVNAEVAVTLSVRMPANRKLLGRPNFVTPSLRLNLETIDFLASLHASFSVNLVGPHFRA